MTLKMPTSVRQKRPRKRCRKVKLINLEMILLNSIFLDVAEHIRNLSGFSCFTYSPPHQTLLRRVNHHPGHSLSARSWWCLTYLQCQPVKMYRVNII